MGTFQHLKSRLLFVIPIVLVLILLVSFSHLFFMKYIILPVLLLVVSFSVYEFSYLVDAIGGLVQARSLLFLVNFFVIVHFFSQIFLGQAYYLPLIVIFVFLLFIISFKFIKGGVNYISYSLLSLIYIVLPLCFLADILLFLKPIDNKLWFAYILIVAKFSDIGGYFFGKLLGKYPMAKRLSPRKTVEGAFFALVFSVGVSVFLKFIFEGLATHSFNNFSYFHMSILGLVIGILALLGDLSESLIKRDACIKHSSPVSNFSGALDLIDSLVFCIPFCYFYLWVLL